MSIVAHAGRKTSLCVFVPQLLGLGWQQPALCVVLSSGMGLQELHINRTFLGWGRDGLSQGRTETQALLCWCAMDPPAPHNARPLPILLHPLLPFLASFPPFSSGTP